MDLVSHCVAHSAGVHVSPELLHFCSFPCLAGTRPTGDCLHTALFYTVVPSPVSFLAPLICQLPPSLVTSSPCTRLTLVPLRRASGPWLGTTGQAQCVLTNGTFTSEQLLGCSGVVLVKFCTLSPGKRKVLCCWRGCCGVVLIVFFYIFYFCGKAGWL